MHVTVNSVVQIVLFLVILLLITKPLGPYMTNVFSGKRIWLSPVFVPIERAFYRLCGVNPEEEQKWTGYVMAMLLMSLAQVQQLIYSHETGRFLGIFGEPYVNVLDLNLALDALK